MELEIERGLTPTSIAWHPTHLVLAIGWQNGLITIWYGDNNTTKEDANVHASPIINITFNPNGHRMVTTDMKGVVAVWRNLSLMSSYQKEGPMTHVIFCDLNLEKNEEKDKEVKEEGEENKDSKEKSRSRRDGKKKPEEEKKEEKKDKKKATQNLFFFGGKGGIVFVADDANHVTEVCKVSGAVKSLFFYEKTNSMIIITSTLLLVQFRISLSERSQHDKKVKLSTAGNPEQLNSIWVGNALLSTICAENLVRAWHVAKDENYVLTLAQVDEMNKGDSLLNDKVLCIDYDEKSRILVGGTQGGACVFWKNMRAGEDSPYDSDQWKCLPTLRMANEPITQISIGKGSSMMAFKYASGVSVVYETLVAGRLSENMKILQNSSKHVQIYLKSDLGQQVMSITNRLNIRWIDCSGKYVLMWTGKKVEIYEVGTDIRDPKMNLMNEFPTDRAVNLWIHKDHTIICQDYGIIVTTLQGQAKQSVSFPESEGPLKGSNKNNNFLVVYTMNNYLRIYDLSRRELKQVGVTRRFEDSKGSLGENIQCNINCDGSKVSILATVKINDNYQTALFIYDVEVDAFHQYLFEEGKTPLDTTWDQTDKRFFGAIADFKRKINPDEDGYEEDKETSGKELHSFFFSSEHGIKKQADYRLGPETEGICALFVPYCNYIVRSANDYQIEEKPLKDFSGLDKIDDYTKKAIMNFGYFLSIGNMDEAYRSVKLIQNPLVWENMAQMCVKTKRIDVAETCLGNMRFARGTKLVRESKTHDAVEPQLAMVAVQLGMIDDARKLYEDCKRYDLLNTMYQAMGEWDKAIQTAEHHDRISLSTTYYRMAKQFEVSKDFEKAIEFYEKSKTHVKEVPRMLMNAGEIDKLENYVLAQNDKELNKYWGHYVESQGLIDDAVTYYKKAEDYADWVRLLIVQGDMNQAIGICEETNDPIACYNLAKQLEQMGKISEAVQMYAKARQSSYAIKLAIENEMDHEIMSLTVNGPREVMLKVAHYFEQKGYNEKAIILYIKGRNFKRALDLSMKFKLFDYINKITGEIDSNKDTDPEVLAAVGSHFMEANQPDKAVHLLIASGQHEKALELCLEHNIPINEEMIEKILPKKENESAADEQKRANLLRTVAKNAKRQGNFGLASHLYMQLGEKLKAAKCLVKQGDTETLIKFAGNARSAEIYILTANYLQNSDWHNNPNLMKKIIEFYTKAKSYQHLAGFYDACASVEVDEYRDYDRASKALEEAIKYATKSTSEDKESKIQMLQQKKHFIDRFTEARQQIESNPQDVLRVCQQLLSNPGAESAVRAGDVFAQMIELYYHQGDGGSAYKLVQQMQERGIMANRYVDQEMLDNIYNAAGVSPQGRSRRPQTQQQFVEEDVENIDEDI